MSRKLYGLLAAVTLLRGDRDDGVRPAQAGGARGRRRRHLQVEDGLRLRRRRRSKAIWCGPTASSSIARKGAKHSSLIKIRENFIPEMIKSAEDI